jgi:molybdenum cofactor biosynthesis enzyme MoaA
MGGRLVSAVLVEPGLFYLMLSATQNIVLLAHLACTADMALLLAVHVSLDLIQAPMRQQDVYYVQKGHIRAQRNHMHAANANSDCIQTPAG